MYAMTSVEASSILILGFIVLVFGLIVLDGFPFAFFRLAFLFQERFA